MCTATIPQYSSHNRNVHSNVTTMCTSIKPHVQSQQHNIQRNVSACGLNSCGFGQGKETSLFWARYGTIRVNKTRRMSWVQERLLTCHTRGLWCVSWLLTLSRSDLHALFTYRSPSARLYPFCSKLPRLRDSSSWYTVSQRAALLQSMRYAIANSHLFISLYCRPISRSQAFMAKTACVCIMATNSKQYSLPDWYRTDIKASIL